MGKKISALTAITGANVDADNDVLPIVDTSAGSDGTKKITVTELLANSTSFTQSGTGATARSVSSKLKDIVSVKDFGAVGDGSTDDSSAITSAIAAVSAAGGGIVFLPPATYLVNSTVTLKDEVSIVGGGYDASIIDFRGTGQAFVGNEAIDRVFYRQFQIKNESNSNSGAAAMVWNRGLNRSHVDVYYRAKSGDTADGFVVHGTQNNDGATANHNQYGCVWDVTTYAATEVTGTALKLNGKDVTNARCNAHDIRSGVLDGFSTGLYINGNGNKLGAFTINACSVAGVHLYGDGSFGNVMAGTYLDSGITGDPIRLESTASRLAMLRILGTVNDLSESDIVDASSGGNSACYTLVGGRRFIAARASSANVVSPGSSSAPTLFAGQDDEDLCHFAAAESHLCGGLMVSGSQFAGGINAVSNYGGFAAKIASHGSASFRVVKTPNGSSYSKLWEMAQDGGVSALTSPSSKTISAVDTSDDKLTITGHALVTAQRVTFRQTGGSDPGGLTSGTRYYAIVVDANTVKLATSESNALAGTAIDITTAGGGTLTLVTGGLVGSFTMDAAASKTIDNPVVTSNSVILLMPTNAAAGTLQGSAEHLYVSAAAGRFTVNTAAGTSADGTETFRYIVLN